MLQEKENHPSRIGKATGGLSQKTKKHYPQSNSTDEPIATVVASAAIAGILGDKPSSKVAGKTLLDKYRDNADIAPLWAVDATHNGAFRSELLETTVETNAQEELRIAAWVTQGVDDKLPSLAIGEVRYPRDTSRTIAGRPGLGNPGLRNVVYIPVHAVQEFLRDITALVDLAESISIETNSALQQVSFDSQHEDQWVDSMLQHLDNEED